MKNTLTIGQRVRVSELDDNQCKMLGGAKPRLGIIEDIVKDMYDGSPLYLVRVLGKTKTYKAESLLPSRKSTKKNQNQ